MTDAELIERTIAQLCRMERRDRGDGRGDRSDSIMELDTLLFAWQERLEKLREDNGNDDRGRADREDRRSIGKL